MNREIKSEQEQIEFYNKCLKRFQQASNIVGEKKFYYDIAGTVVCLNFAGESMIPYLTPALSHLEINNCSQADFTINVWDSSSTGIEMIPPPCSDTAFTYRGDIWGFESKRIKTAFHWSEFSVNVVDLDSNEGVYWVKKPESFPYWVYSSPFRSIINWWMEKNNCQLLHAAAIGTEEGAVLITGKGGVGKSTTAVTCLGSNLYYIGDDYVIVKKDPIPMVYSLYSTAKIKMEELDNFSSLKQFADKPVEENQEKAVLFLYPGLKDKIRRKMPIKAIFTPRITKKEDTSIENISFWPIQRAMSFTTMSQLPGVGKHTHDYINNFTSNLPCYTINLGSDRNLITETIINFLLEEIEIVDSKLDNSEFKPLITVIVPVYNGGLFINEAIENILSQEYEAIEIIIVDDGSTDNSQEIIDNLDVDVRYINQGNAGPAAARNRGIADASGEYIAFLDVDDLWPENNLKMLLSEFEYDSSLKVVRGFAQLFRRDEKGQDQFIENPMDSFKDYIGGGLYRKSVFAEVGLFDRALTFGEDVDWYNRAYESKILMKRLEEITLFVRRHGNNMTEGKSLLELNAIKVLKMAIERQRLKS